MKTEILGVSFDVLTNEQVLDLAYSYLNISVNHVIVTPNPEMVMKATKDDNFKKILNSSDICIPDGIGVVYASKLNKIKITQRVAGCDLTFSLLEKSKSENKNIYILGAGKGVAEKAKINIEEKYKGVNVVGYHDGYFSKDEESTIVDEISKLNVDILLIGLGMVKQELFAHTYKDKLNTKLTLCIGGTIDVLSGEVKRAPQLFIQLNLEWLYRILKDPKRIYRSFSLPLFVFKVILAKLRR